jgi:hypothetical protein
MALLVRLCRARPAGIKEMVQRVIVLTVFAGNSKSAEGNLVGVRPLPAPKKIDNCYEMTLLLESGLLFRCM